MTAVASSVASAPAPHSPGEWVDAGPAGYGRVIRGGSADDPRYIAVAYGKRENPESEANVRLICAAPQMLSALGMVLPILREESEVRRRSYLPGASAEERLLINQAADAVKVVAAAIEKATRK